MNDDEKLLMQILRLYLKMKSLDGKIERQALRAKMEELLKKIDEKTFEAWHVFDSVVICICWRRVKWVERQTQAVDGSSGPKSNGEGVVRKKRVRDARKAIGKFIWPAYRFLIPSCEHPPEKRAWQVRVVVIRFWQMGEVWSSSIGWGGIG